VSVQGNAGGVDQLLALLKAITAPENRARLKLILPRENSASLKPTSPPENSGAAEVTAVKDNACEVEVQVLPGHCSVLFEMRGNDSDDSMTYFTVSNCQDLWIKIFSGYGWGSC